MCNILKFAQKFSSTYSILAYLFTAMLCDDSILRHIAFMRIVFCFNGFNQTADRSSLFCPR